MSPHKKLPLNKKQKEFARDVTRVIVGFTFLSSFIGLYRFLKKWIIIPIIRKIKGK
jgi:hypothetical protein